MKKQIQNAREFSGHLKKQLFLSYPMHLKYRGEIDDELWSIIDYYSEIDENCKRFLKDKGLSGNSINKISKLFSSHIRQAKNYYYAGKKLPNITSSLFYYYCFLNLANALIVINYPQLAGNDFYHGLRIAKNKRPRYFANEKVIISIGPNNVFPQLYKLTTGQMPKLNSINISRILGYCTDIGFQYIQSNYGEQKVIPVYYANVIDEQDKTLWSLLAINQFNLLNRYKKTIKKFPMEFEEVVVDKLLIRGIFGMDPIDQGLFKIFQSRATKKLISNPIAERENANKIKEIFKNIFQPNYFDKEISFFIVLPYSLNNQKPFNEMLAIYVIMFYLSSLVRYRPDYIESLYRKKDFWLIDNFIKFCPISFLRTFIPLLINKDYVLIK